MLNSLCLRNYCAALTVSLLLGSTSALAGEVNSLDAVLASPTYAAFEKLPLKGLACGNVLISKGREYARVAKKAATESTDVQLAQASTKSAMEYLYSGWALKDTYGPFKKTATDEASIQIANQFKPNQPGRDDAVAYCSVHVQTLKAQGVFQFNSEQLGSLMRKVQLQFDIE